MDPGLRTSASGMIAQQKMVDVIANNLANVNTTGFKRSRASFEDVLYETVQGARTVDGELSVGPLQVGRGVRLAAVAPITTEGSPEQTDRPLDLAINGEGYFQVQMPDGTIAYTRDGSFTLSATGELVTNDGQAMVPNIVIPADSTNITIANDGTVSVTGGKTNETVEVGKIELARFANPAGLFALGENLFGETVASGPPTTGDPAQDGFGSILQGTLESSNVEVVQEMTDMIAAQRAYEINSKAITTADNMMQSLEDLLH